MFPFSMRLSDRSNLSTPVLLEDPVLAEIAKKYNQTVALVALRYQIQRGLVVLLKSFNKQRIEENIKVKQPRRGLYQLHPPYSKTSPGIY